MGKLLLKDQCHVKWLIDEDHNTSFLFHSFCKRQKANKPLSCL